jgi:iron complex transport system ATP-binding protein
MVLVTHHLEEIPPGFTHAALLRGGAITAQGPLDRTLTDEAVSAAFGLPLTVRRGGGRWGAVAA